MINVGVVGATGYVGAELMRLLQAHPQVNIALAISKNFAGQQMADVYANFSPLDIVLSEGEVEQIAQTCSAVFLCLPHGQSIKMAPKFIEKGLRVVDLSGDFRYEDTAVYEEWYGMAHTEKQLNAQAVYGMPEYYRQSIAGAKFIANPGCYTTTSILALAPLLKAGLINSSGIVIDAKSGVTGAGRQEKLAYSFCETADNFKAYSVVAHRHTSEIEEQLGSIAGGEIRLLFTPHLLPVKRGILATVYADLQDGVTAESIADAYGKAYAKEPFTHVLQHGKLPELKYVVGSNNCMIGFQVSQRLGKVVVVSCTDNLLKGAAGQAVHNFNIMHGLEEATGLSNIAWYL